MEFEISFIEVKGYFLIKTSGETTPHDIERSLNEVTNHPNWTRGTDIVFDNRMEDLSKLSSDDIKDISLKFLKFNRELKGSKIALVMPEDFAYGLARMWEIHTQNVASFVSTVFRSLDDATKWVGE